jgi:integrase/recombinase XerD
METKPLIYLFRKIKKSTERFINGEHEVRIRLSQFKEREFISLGYSSSIQNWDEEHFLPKPSHPNYKTLFQKINKYLDDIAFEIKLAERCGRFITCHEVKHKVLHRDNNPIQQHRHLKILEFFDKVITNLEEAGNPGYADIFRCTRSTVSRLLNNSFITLRERKNEKDKSFLDFNKEDHQNYEKLISNGTSESTISLYLRNYYRIWNLAISEGYCSREEHHPAKHIKFNAYKRIRTKKRAINQEYLIKIMNREYNQDSHFFFSHLLIQFIYYGRGINFGDLCKLKWQNFANETIHYIRSKNHREYDYILHFKALEVINYFKNYAVKNNAGYIFPILRSIYDTPRKIEQHIKSALKDFNKDLKEMAEAVGWQRDFTSYSLRHSFATHLRNNGVNISVIKEALGHELEKQTAVYLEELDDKLIADEINRALNFDSKKSK